MMLVTFMLSVTIAQAQIKLGEFDKSGRYSLIKTYTPFPIQISRNKLIENLNNSLKKVTVYYYIRGEDIPYRKKRLIAYNDRIDCENKTILPYSCVFIGLDAGGNVGIELYKQPNGNWDVWVKLTRDCFKEIESGVQFMCLSQENAQQLAENIYYVLQPYRDKQIVEQQEKDSLATADSIQFNLQAAQYREMAEKPSLTEEQRRYIVQANAFAKDKAYASAIDAYQKAIVANPVAYPATYYNMALLYAETKDYKQAVRNMKKYLLLVPDAPDARAAQDKIYEWER